MSTNPPDKWVTLINQHTGAVTKFRLESVTKIVRLAHRRNSLRAIAFSDWRVQSFDTLARFIKQQPMPDLILYAGDDVERFQQEKQNHFEQLAKLSRYGLCAVAGNDDPPETRKLIRGKNVYAVHSCAVLLGHFAIVGLDGAPAFPKEFGPGFNRGSLLYPEPILRRQMARWGGNCVPKQETDNRFPHTALWGSGLRDQTCPRHIGNRPLKEFLESSRSSIICVCGHVHRCGAQNERLGSALVVNAASHDSPDSEGIVAVIQLDKNDSPTIEWHSLSQAAGIPSRLLPTQLDLF